MESQQKKTIVLLPVYFKKIGIIVLIAELVVALSIKLTAIDLTPLQKEIYKIILSDCFTLGLLFIAGSRDRNEDERTISLRLTSLASTFFVIVLYEMIYPIVNLIGNTTIMQSAASIINFMICMYLLNYYGRKEFN